MTEQVCGIRQVLEEHNSAYIDIDNQLSLHKIHTLICEHIVKDDPINSLECLYFGWYYSHIEKNYNLMKKYYEIAIQHGDSKAMYNMGIYYHNVDKDYDKMKRCYIAVIKNRNILARQYAIQNLSWYYEHEGKNDLSLIDFFDIPSLKPLLCKRLKVIKKIPKEFHCSFCKWNFADNHKLKIKQDILKQTGIYPCNYDPTLLSQFGELLSLSKQPLVLPKDIILTIAGYLFI